MKTKIVYVLVSNPNDFYLEQAYVSMHSLRIHQSDAHIVLLTDSSTAKTLTGIRKNEVKYVDELVVVDIDSRKYNAQQRSRQLKTSIRNRIDGDFLFIDCDTIVTRRLDDIDSIDASIAACRDTHSCFSNNPYRDMCLEHGHLLGWPIDDEKDYFNSGVIYVKDVPDTHEFYQRWNNNLNKGYYKGVYMDQPSFAKTNYEMGHIINHLPDVWNCELKHGIRYLKDAYIVHYLCTNPSVFQNEQLFLMNEQDSLMEVKNTGVIGDNINSVINNPFMGLAEITHCFAGEDIYFFRSDYYNILRKLYIKRKVPFFLCQILKLYDLKMRISKKMRKILKY